MAMAAAAAGDSSTMSKKRKKFSPLDETKRKKVDRCISIRCIPYPWISDTGELFVIEIRGLLISHLDLCKLEPGVFDLMRDIAL